MSDQLPCRKPVWGGLGVARRANSDVMAVIQFAFDESESIGVFPPPPTIENFKALAKPLAATQIAMESRSR